MIAIRMIAVDRNSPKGGYKIRFQLFGSMYSFICILVHDISVACLRPLMVDKPLLLGRVVASECFQLLRVQSEDSEKSVKL